MLNKLTEYGDTITLTPQSGVQFVEYGFDVGKTPRFTRSFIERQGDKKTGSEEVEYTLLPNWDDGDTNAEPPHAVGPSDDEYDITKQRALDVFMGKWVPVPFLRIEPGRDRFGNETYARGPMDWVRVRVVETRDAHGDSENTHRVVFAFDTSLLEQRPNRPYLGVTPQDAQQTESFRFVYRLNDIAGFLSNVVEQPESGGKFTDTQAWLKIWLETIFRDSKKAQYPNRPLRAEDFPHKLEHIALYITLIGFIAQTVEPAKITLIDTVSADPDVAPIDVDLILDIGNARTCGLLIQSFPNDDSTDLNRSLALELRNLAAPEIVYRDPFESHVELVQAEFGPEDLARHSGRSRAFFWPSFVRLGVEAAQLRAESEGTESMTGLSSPKRYLWDVEPVTQNWRMRTSTDDSDLRPLIERSIYRYVNNRGDVLEQIESDRRTLGLRPLPEHLESADSLRFSRSSFFTFMTLEIISQAMMMINNPGVRRRDREKDSPRRLRRIIMTIPSATPVQEQRILRSRAEAALKLFWSLMGWNSETLGIYKQPEVHTSWDEASSVHLVYLYGEVTQKLGGSIEVLFDFLGKDRIRTDYQGTALSTTPERSLRIASIDIGGGTTDLMVTTYFQRDNQALIPVQNFREGFRKAGDDLVKLTIERAVIPAIEAHLSACGIAYARDLLREQFSDDKPGMTQADKHLRRHFVLRYLRPVALGILAACEEMGSGTRGVPSRPYTSFFPEGEFSRRSGRRILDYLETIAVERGAKGFSLADVSVPVDPSIVAECISAAFEKVFVNIAEAVNKLDADVVLLTGRPSCLPGVVSLFANQLGIGVHRIVPVSAYRVGNWYPFRQTARDLIADPKTTAVVGGMLCALAAGQLTNFTMYTDGLTMRSTARFIGEIRQDGVIPVEKTYFSEVDLDSRPAEGTEAELVFNTAARLGYRQLSRVDWVSTPLYRLRFKPGVDVSSVKRPINVTLERKSIEVEEDASSLKIMHGEATSEEFRITNAEDANGRMVARLLDLKFDTSPVGTDGVYWLDSGILTIA